MECGSRDVTREAGAADRRIARCGSHTEQKDACRADALGRSRLVSL